MTADGRKIGDFAGSFVYAGGAQRDPHEMNFRCNVHANITVRILLRSTSGVIS